MSNTQRETEVKEPEEPEGERAEAASRRKGRGDRQKGEGWLNNIILGLSASAN